MSFYSTYEKYKDGSFENVTDSLIKKSLGSEVLSPEGFAALLSSKAEDYLEEAAQKAHSLTVRNFGKTVHLYTPLYLSNWCENECAYCGFNLTNKIERRILELDEVRKEAEFIASTGLKNILILTGSSREKTPVSYLAECVKILKDHFSSICIEVYSLTQDEYKTLIEEGVDGLTIYQETYDEELYSELHLSGPKRDYLFRLEAPERALAEGMRLVNIGVLFGLSDWRRDAFFLGMHAAYLQDKFPAGEISVSLPRIRPQVGGFEAGFNVRDKNIVQAVLALRMFLPRVGITLSTREDELFRENLMPLGVTRMSAGSTTKVGGHTLKTDGLNVEQFEICDTRGVEDIKNMLRDKKYQPVLKDWVG
ncbi:2-iminoacetate synthase ThiH [Candidatus Omnitrophota bacterium]